jgi:Arm DNA-binding domain
MLVFFVGSYINRSKRTNKYMKLTNTQCKNAKFNPDGKDNKLTDGGGLYLHIKDNGKYWRIAGKQKTLYVGVYPEISLADARKKRDDAKKLLADGKDPSTEKKIAKLELQINYANNFEAIAREWHQHKRHTWEDKHAETILKRLEVNVFRKIGNRPIKEIKPVELLDAIRTLENEGKRDLAHRQLQHCGQIFRYAVATGRATHDITTNLKGALQPVQSKHYAHLQEKELPDFLSKLSRYDISFGGNTLTKLAFQLLILTFVRSGELRGALWQEIDFDKAQWKIPDDHRSYMYLTILL